MKIEIKTNNDYVLFAYEREDNSVKKTVEKAVNNGVNLRHAYLPNADLYATNLHGANFRGANLREADLREADLRGASLGCADLRGVDLRGADLRGAYLLGANLQGANLFNVNLCGADLCNADLRNAKIRELNLIGTNLCDANLGNADLGDWGKISSVSDVLVVGPIGSRQSHTTIFHTNKGIFVRCGCFRGTLDDFARAVKDTHAGTKHGKNYNALIELIKIKLQD